MANLITSMRSTSRVTSGERRFGERLQALLEDDCLCWYNIPVGYRRRYPDFVVLHPRRGLLLLEVKDWKIQDLKRFDKFKVEVLFGDVLKSEVNPLEQARQCLLELVEQLKRDPQLCHDSGSYRGKLSFPYGWGVVLANITRKQFDAALSEEEQELVLPGRLVICRDEMTESVTAEAFEERLWNMFQYRFQQPMSLPQIERVRWHLFPDIRIETVQRDLFDDEPVPDLVKVLDLQQEQLARNLGSGHRVIHGVAGSGKTLILGYRCTQLATSLAKPVLVLCFNVSLATRLLRFIEDRNLTEKVHVHHFHEWCGLQLKTYGIDLPAGDAPIWERQVTGVISAVDRSLIPRAQYGAVMIDEGHDFEPDWLKLVVQMVDPATDSFLLLYDDAQSIYQRGGRPKFSLSSVGIKATGRTTILRLNYRNSREILKFAYDFAKDDMGPQGADEDHIPLIEPESAGLSGPVPKFKLAAHSRDEMDYSVRCIRHWIAQGTPRQEIALICFKTKHGQQISERLHQEGIDHLWMADKKRKKEYNPALPRVTVLTAQSSKGLEFQSVIVLGIGQLADGKEDLPGNTRLLYVSMTRARRHLALAASSTNAFTGKLIHLAS